MRNVDLLIVGAGPAGLSAAIQAGSLDLSVLLVDENSKPGGQLFKQIHKFFGSQAHKAGVRGFEIGNKLLESVNSFPNVETWLGATVISAIDSNHIEIVHENQVKVICCSNLIVATGALEKSLSFPGWTLPGVMGAGALQTMINLNRVLPGKRMVMVGSGNVGLIVSYQFMQAGGEVAGLVEAAPCIGGYGVHAAKIRRYGAPIMTKTTVKEAKGKDKVESVVLTSLDEKFCSIAGSEREVKTDIIAVGTGLVPLAELLRLLGCRFSFVSKLGGWVPVHNDRLETTIKGVFVAGDVSGIEEASTAMEEGRLAACSVAADQGKIAGLDYEEISAEIRKRMNELRSGPFGFARHEAKAKIFESFC
jgi:thioredoxin reductase